MKKPGLLASMLVLSLSALAPLTGGATTYTYINIDYSGADLTQTTGINNAQITTISGGADVAGNSVVFRYTDLGFVPLPPTPADVFNQGPWAINDYGVIVGAWLSATLPGGGYLLDGSTYTIVSPPAAYDGMDFRGINNAGLVAGRAINSANSLARVPGLSATVGFTYDPVTGVFTDFVDPVNNIFENSVWTIAHGINSAGQVNGSVRLPRFITGHQGGDWGFLRESDGTVTKFRVGGDDNPTRPRGINDNGVMAGQVDILDPVTKNFVTHGFIGTSAGFKLLDVPFTGAIGTLAYNINNVGQVVGYWNDDTTSHGFYATPAEIPTGTTPGGAYTFSVEVVPDTPIFIDPQVALGYEYAIGETGPNFASTRPPIGFGDNKYTILVHGRAFPVVGGQLFDFRANGYPDGVAKFRIAGIDDVAKVDPLNMLAFPTQVAFVGAGTFSGTMTPLCLRHPLPPQASTEALTRAIGNCIR